MADGARSDDPAVQKQLDRLALRSPGADILGLERIAELCARLGHPERSLPPVFHVAGTNGKGSVCAFLRAAIEAAGLKAHVYTSPHLVRFNERIRVAGQLIDDTELAALLKEVLDVSDDLSASFFEVTTAAAFLAFSRNAADATILEVGLGGRLDATNVVPRPAICGIASLGVDHEAFLSADINRIASEKAGIAKPGVEIVTQRYGEEVTEAIARTVKQRGAEAIVRGTDWDGTTYDGQLHYRDHEGKLRLPLPRLPGPHQIDNALLAIAMLRYQQKLAVPESALRAAMEWAEWAARLQRLQPGPLRDLLPADAELILDGGHNPLAGEAIAAALPAGERIYLVMGLLANKDPEGLLGPLAPHIRSARFVDVPNHQSHDPETMAQLARNMGFTASTADCVEQALSDIAANGKPGKISVLIAGSLYLAGEVLRANEQPPN